MRSTDACALLLLEQQSTSVRQALADRGRDRHPRRMTEQPDDPRARFRQLPEDPIRPEQWVETQDAEPPVAGDAEPEPAWRAVYFGGGLP